MIEEFLDRLSQEIGRISGVYHFELSLWGNDLGDSFQYNYDFYNYSQSFMGVRESESREGEVFLIVGAINFKQVSQIKKRYERVKSEKKTIIHLRGSIGEKDLQKSYVGIECLKDYIPVDFEYRKYPFDLEEIMDCIIKSQK